MILQLLIGAAVISVTIVVEAVFISLAVERLSHASAWLLRPPHGPRGVLAMVLVTLC